MSVSREPVGRALDVLAWVADHPGTPLVVRQIARDLDTTPSTVHRILGAFQQRGIIARGGNGEYVTGLQLYRICGAISAELSPVRIARPHLQELSQECDETTMLGVYDSGLGKMMFIERVEALHALRYIVEMHQWLPLHAGATGYGILAFLPEAVRHRIYRAGLDSMTPHTIVDVEALESELEAVRARGYAHSVGHRTPGAAGFAAPVFDSAGMVCGDVCLTLPAQRFLEGERAAESIGALVMAAAQRVTRDLTVAGYQMPARESVPK